MSGVVTTTEYNRAYIIVCIFYIFFAHLDTLNRNKCISTAYYICRGAASKLRTWQAWGHKRRHPDHQIKDIQCCLKLAKLFTLGLCTTPHYVRPIYNQWTDTQSFLRC